jgi:hypothetical protein
LQTGEVTTLDIAAGTAEYRIDLLVGAYTAFTWRAEYRVGQGYSEMVVDAAGERRAVSLRPIEVAEGATATADLCDPLPLEVRPPGSGSGPSPAGLVFASGEGLLVTDGDGRVQIVLDVSPAELSPGGRRALYVQDDDLWLADLDTGERRNLTNTPDRIELLPRWWPARPGWVAFSSYARGREITLGPGVFPTLVMLDGTGYTVIDETADAYQFSLSPDGRTVAYGLGPSAWLYDADSAAYTAFDPAAFGLDLSGTDPAPVSLTIGKPAFAPDGRRISWLLGQQLNDGSSLSGHAVFDLEARTAVVVHPHAVAGTDGVPPAAAWSPDGQWLALEAWAADPAQAGLWVARSDGQVEQRLGEGTGPVWSPDGLWVAWMTPQNEILATAAATWETQPLAHPVGAGLAGWRRLP